jgi:mannose-6-phosphate isomerase-like protein (cupin superfamily)
MNFEKRLCGSCTVLGTETNFQAKKLFVTPGKRLSLQRHIFRTGHWFVIPGTGLVELKNNSESVSAGDSVDVPIGINHRISYFSHDPLVFIRVHSRKNFNERDIMRYKYDFGRN